jgi:hypothetical protein
MIACRRQSETERPLHGPARRRRGLSMLELVLSLPVLMLVTALIINAGTAACWKARSEMVVRHAIGTFRHTDDPHLMGEWPVAPNYWSVPGATIGRTPRDNVLPELDDPRLQHAVVRGPTLLGFNVNSNLLNPATGFNTGHASLRRRFPLLSKTMGFHLYSDNVYMELGWEFYSKTMDLIYNTYSGYSNVGFRMPKLYIISPERLAAVAPLLAAYREAVMAIVYAPFYRDLDPLNRDDEWRYYTSLYSGWPWAPDFHPHPSYGCTSSVELIQRRVDNMTSDRGPIQRVPRNMTRSFIRLYRWATTMLQLQLMSDPPPTPDIEGQIRDEIAQLEVKINTLEAFLATLPR